MKEWKRERNHKKSLCLEPLEETHTTTQPCGNHRLLLWSRHKKRIPGKVSAWPSPIKHQIKNISKALVHFNFKTGAKWSENLSSPTSNSRLIRRNWLWAGDTYALSPTDMTFKGRDTPSTAVHQGSTKVLRQHGASTRQSNLPFSLPHLCVEEVTSSVVP